MFVYKFNISIEIKKKIFKRKFIFLNRTYIHSYIRRYIDLSCHNVIHVNTFNLKGKCFICYGVAGA